MSRCSRWCTQGCSRSAGDYRDYLPSYLSRLCRLCGQKQMRKPLRCSYGVVRYERRKAPGVMNPKPSPEKQFRPCLTILCRSFCFLGFLLRITRFVVCRRRRPAQLAPALLFHVRGKGAVYNFFRFCGAGVLRDSARSLRVFTRPAAARVFVVSLKPVLEIASLRGISGFYRLDNRKNLLGHFLALGTLFAPTSSGRRSVLMMSGRLGVVWLTSTGLEVAADCSSFQAIIRPRCAVMQAAQRHPCLR